MGTGIVLVLLSTVLLTAGIFLPRLISSQADPVQISFVRYLGGFLCVAVARLFGAPTPGGDGRTQVLEHLLHLLRIAIGAGTLVLTIVAARLLSIGTVQAILACHGMVVLAWLAGRNTERIRPGVIVATAVGIAGTALCSQVGGGAHSMTGYAAAIGAAVCWAAEILVFRHVVTVTTGNVSLFAMNLLGVLLLAGPALARWQPVGGGELTVLLCVGPLLVGAQACLIHALRLVPLSITIPLRYFNVPLAMLLGFLFLDQIPSVLALLGALMVVGSGSLLTSAILRAQPLRRGHGAQRGVSKL